MTEFREEMRFKTVKAESRSNSLNWKEMDLKKELLDG